VLLALLQLPLEKSHRALRVRLLLLKRLQLALQLRELRRGEEALLPLVMGHILGALAHINVAARACTGTRSTGWRSRAVGRDRRRGRLQGEVALLELFETVERAVERVLELGDLRCHLLLGEVHLAQLSALYLHGFT
jgi:hypothetical protein